LGTPVEIIQQRLGHARASITLDTYTHREHEDQVEAVDAFSKHLKKLAEKPAKE
jgi:integrase